ncbi:hypothetical protein H4R35_001703 [Dimargaris xerosporica]|nr:hypothetical protein H4R35_001703 [Dimargaris xerosporica]
MAALLLPPAKSPQRWSLFKRPPVTMPKDSFEFQHGGSTQALAETMTTMSSAEPSLFSNDPHDDNDGDAPAHAASTDDPSLRLVSRKTTRRQRRFQLAFPGVPLPVARSMYKSFKCALDYDVFWKGYLFITPQAVYFYGRRLNPFVRFNTAAVAMVHPDADTASASSYPTAVHICLTFDTISSIHKESILGMFPNVIRIKTPRRHYILAGFYARESAYCTLRTAWQRHHTNTGTSNAASLLGEEEPFPARGASTALIRQGGALHRPDTLVASQTPSRHIAFASPPDTDCLSVQSTPRISRSTVSDHVECHTSTPAPGRLAKSTTLMGRLSAFGRKVSRRKPKPAFSDPPKETTPDASRLTSSSSPTIVVPQHDPLPGVAILGASVQTAQLVPTASTLSPASSTQPSTPIPSEAIQPRRSHRSQGRRRRRRPLREQTDLADTAEPGSPKRLRSPMGPRDGTNHHNLPAGSGNQLQGKHMATTLSSDATGHDASKCNTSPALPPLASHSQNSNKARASSQNFDSLHPQASRSSHLVDATSITAEHSLPTKSDAAPVPKPDKLGYFKSPPLTLGLNTVTSAFHDIKSHIPSLPYTNAVSWAPLFNLAKKAPQMLTHTLTSEWSSGTREVATSTADLPVDDTSPKEDFHHPYHGTAPDEASMSSVSGISDGAFDERRRPYYGPTMANPAAISRQSVGSSQQQPPTPAATRVGRWFPNYLSLATPSACYNESAFTKADTATADAWTVAAGPALSVMPSKLASDTAARRWSLPGADIEHWLQSQAHHQALAQSYHMVSTFHQQSTVNGSGARPLVTHDRPRLRYAGHGPTSSVFGHGMLNCGGAGEAHSQLAHDLYYQAQPAMLASPTASGYPEPSERLDELSLVTAHRSQESCALTTAAASSSLTVGKEGSCSCARYGCHCGHLGTTATNSIHIQSGNQALRRKLTWSYSGEWQDTSSTPSLDASKCCDGTGTKGHPKASKNARLELAGNRLHSLKLAREHGYGSAYRPHSADGMPPPPPGWVDWCSHNSRGLAVASCLAAMWFWYEWCHVAFATSR